MKLLLSFRAKEDLLEIWEYIAQHDELAADRYIEHLWQRSMELMDYPDLGRARNEIQPKIRSLLSRNHLLFYRIESSEIQILRVLHGSRDLSNQEYPSTPI